MLTLSPLVPPRQLRMLVERLGPTFIKLAQALSTRGDILPAEYITEIELLQVTPPPPLLPFANTVTWGAACSSEPT